MSYKRTIEEILLRRKHKLTIVASDDGFYAGKAEKAMIATIAKNIESLGFAFSNDVINILLTYSMADIEAFYKDLIPNLQSLVGADVEYRPMYPNFPTQVMEASEAELLINALVHYISDGTLMPKCKEEPRIPLFDANKMTFLSFGDITDVLSIFQNILSSKTSISPQDRDDIEKIVENYPDFYDYLPIEIPMKENVALVAKLITDKAPIKVAGAIQKYFKTATDVLRYVVAISDGDISLSKPTKFKHMRRCERRMVMDLLAGCNDILEDMYRYKNEWLRIGEIVHPSTYTNAKYCVVRAAFDTLRNEKKPLFLPGKIQLAIQNGNVEQATELLKHRPGDFARQLDKLLRASKDKSFVIKCFNDVADKVSTPVLLQVRQHFIGRDITSPIRVFFPKGNLARSYAIKNELQSIDRKYCDDIVDICDHALISQYCRRDPMGNVFIDKDMVNYLVPFSQRSSSKSNKIVVRGSKMPITDTANVIRAFIWWTNVNCRYSGMVDIDLSATIFDEDWKYLDHVSYTNLRSSLYNACHSGDIVNGGDPDGDGVAEFIDIDISVANKLKARYIVFQVYSYRGIAFSQMPNCRFGWMEREYPGSGEIFEPSTVEMKTDLVADSVVAIPAIFDVYERKFIWCDMSLNIESVKDSYGGINAESNINNVIATCFAMVNLNKTNLYDLIRLNAIARGNIVETKEEADIIFSNDTEIPVANDAQEQSMDSNTQRHEQRVITAYDADYFMGQLI